MSSVKYNYILPEGDDEEIVISGISGRFPNSRTMNDLAYNLYNKIDMVDEAETRWKHTHPDIPKRSGKVPDINKFDATFFGVHFRQATNMDPQNRLLLEHAYEAVIDAGINPIELRGSNTGVFTGVAIAEADRDAKNNMEEGYVIVGCNRGMMANRISYVLDVNGPSFVVDSACSSSMMAIDCAYRSIRNGECEAALACATNMTLFPITSLQFAKLGVTAPDGICMPFDEEAHGYTRSEAMCVILLQKRKHAKRCYATLVHSKINCDGYKEEGVTFPSSKSQLKLLQTFYNEIKLNPATVDFLEAHGTGTKVGDPEECSAIYEVFCNGRKGPLPIGSIKSNLGHSEPVSGLCSIAKLIILLENRKIPPNIHFNTPRQSILPLKNGDLKVITETTDFNGSLTAASSFGFGGANGHVLLRGNNKVKVNHGIPADKLPRLLCWAGRTEEACNKIFDEVLKRPLDAEFIGLLQSIQTQTVSANVCRGYAIFNQEGTGNAICSAREMKIAEKKQPLVWVFSGMGSQWVGMGKDLMQLPLFKTSIEKCHEILKPLNLDLINIITSDDPTIFDNILHSFVGIAAIQIALVDVLKELEIDFDYVIGHSVGELGCAYADNCFTAEEMILSAYSRGMASLETEVIFGSMAAIGLSYQQIRPLLPTGIEVACHNGIDSSTISGPADLVASFVEELKSKNVFAKEVPCSNIPYHSKYIANMGPKLLARLQQVIKAPKKRSPKWLSSSVAKHHWDKEESWYCSPEYQTNNLLNPVLFEETMTLLPQDAVTLEISPHALLQAILRKSLPNATHLTLTKRGSRNNLEVLLAGIGKLFMNKIDIPVSKLYPPIQFPVSIGTPMISPLILWDHSADWYVPTFTINGDGSGEQTFKISIEHDEYKFITGHKIDGRVLFPATGYVWLVWKTFANMYNLSNTDVAIEMSDVQFVRATTLTKESPAVLIVTIQRGTGKFEISENNSTVVTGNIRSPDKIRFTEIPNPRDEDTVTMLPTSDFYKELKLRGYHYDGLFRSVLEARSDGLGGKIKWDNDFVSFMDCMLQMSIVGVDSRKLVLPTGLKLIRLDPKLFETAIMERNEEDNTGVVHVTGSKALNLLKTTGLEIQGLRANAVGRRKPPGEPVLESYQFVPYYPTVKLALPDAVRVLVQTGLENLPNLKVKAVECDDREKEPLLGLIQDTLGDLPLVTSELTVLSNRKLDLPGITVENSNLSSQKNAMFIIGSNLCHSIKKIKEVSQSCAPNGFIISRETQSLNIFNLNTEESSVLSVVPIKDEVLVMIQCNRSTIEKEITCVPVSLTDSKYTWLEPVKEALTKGRVYIVAQGEPLSGIIGLVNCLRKEPNSDVVAIFIDDPKAPKFDATLPLYKEQLEKNLAINVYRNGQWGSYRHLLLNNSYNIEEPRSVHVYADAINKGDLSSLTWFQGDLSYNDPSKEIVRVRYSALNFRDVMLATGKLNMAKMEDRIHGECDLGLEYSGITRDGQRVMGMNARGAMSTYVETIKYLTWEVPENWSLREACTVPIVYGTVYYAFFVATRIQSGKKILIHAGTGGVGLSAIRVALAYELEVFTTVSTAEKKKYIRQVFPEIPESHIGNSRDTSFYDMIMLETDGQGVDYVLNSLSDDKLIASLDCLGKDGHFLEIGKYDIMNNSKIGMGIFVNNPTLHVVLVDQLLRTGTDRDKKVLFNLIANDIKRGIIVPLSSTVFKATEVEQAFRYLASAKHIGKVLLEVRENDYDRLSVPLPMVPRVYCQSDLCYVILGGLGGFGLELSDWLILRGCRNLVLSSSRGISKPYQEYRIKLWRSYGVTVYISTVDITTPDGCLELIKEAKSLAPVGGIFNLAVRLRDNIFQNQDAEKFMESMAVKATGTRYLDQISRRLCPQLEHFVVFSSVSCGRGNAGQTNYGAANSVMERVVEQRIADGFPGKAIQWGAIGEVGLVADMAENKVDMVIGGTLQQRISSCLVVLDQLLTVADPIVSSMVVAEKKTRKGAGIVETVLNIMGIRDTKTLSMDVKLSEMGMDSLMAVEIRQTLERDFELFLSPQDLRSLTFQKLLDHVKQKPVNTGVDDLSQQIQLFRNLSEEIGSEINPLRIGSKNNDEKFKSAVLFVPGIEGGVGSAWRKLAASFDLPTFIVQMTKAKNATTIQGILDVILPDLESVIFNKVGEYQIVGYSVGGLVALHIASELEKKGLKGRLILIDSAPVYIKQIALSYVPEDAPNQIELFRLVALHNLFTTYKNKKFIEEVACAADWHQKLAICAKHGQTLYSEQFVKDNMDAVVNRGLMAVNLNINEMPKLNTDILLIRPTVAGIQDIDEDYGLSANTTGNVTVKFLEGDHLTLLDNEKLATVIQETFQK